MLEEGEVLGERSKMAYYRLDCHYIGICKYRIYRCDTMTDGDMSLTVNIIALLIGIVIFLLLYRWYKKKGMKDKDAMKEALEDTLEHKEEIIGTAEDIVKKDTEVLREKLIDGIEEITEDMKSKEK